MNKYTNIAVVGLGQVGIYLLNELNAKNQSADLLDADFKKMSFNEFDQFLKKYSKNSDYPDIN